MSAPEDPLVCSTCVHFTHDITDEDHDHFRFKCAAFPKGIPEVIMYNEFDHHQPFPGDHGMQYQPR